jgi:large subunit ribosomal protein L14
MKSINARITGGLQVGSKVACVDNSGATEVQIIAVKGFKGVRRRNPRSGVGGIVIAAVKKGNPKIRHEVVKAVIIRQRKEYRRKSGLRVKFEDNAVVLVNDKFDPRGTRIKGPVAKEAIERFSTIGKISSIVV